MSANKRIVTVLVLLIGWVSSISAQRNLQTNALLLMTQDGKSGYLDRLGELSSPGFSDAGHFEGLAPIEIGQAKL